MSPNPAKSGLSNREYARRRRVSEAAIRRRRNDGTLADAILPSGRLDPDRADELLAKGTTAGLRTSKDLSEARRRKAAAAVALLSDEVAALTHGVVAIEVAATCVREFVLACAERLWRIADVAPEGMGQSAADAAGIVQEAVIVSLEELSGRSRHDRSDDDAGPVDDLPEERGGPALEKLTAVELATARADLQAAKLEIERGLNRGTIVRVEDVHAMLCDKLANCRSLLLGLHARTGPQLGALNEPSEAVAYLRRELWDAIAELANEYITAEELAAEGPLAAKRAKRKAA